MKIFEMVEVLQAAERGEKIEVSALNDDHYVPWLGRTIDTATCKYRIAPKKQELSLVDELHEVAKEAGALNLPVEQVVLRAADRIDTMQQVLDVFGIKEDNGAWVARHTNKSYPHDELSLVARLRNFNSDYDMHYLDEAADRITDLQNELADRVKRHEECYTLLVDKTRQLHVWKESYEIAETQYRADLIAKTKRIEELEKYMNPTTWNTDALLAEIKRRTL